MSLLLASPPPLVGPPVAGVQTTTVVGNNALNWTAPTTPGNMIILYCLWSYYAGGPGQVTDNGGNTYEQALYDSPITWVVNRIQNPCTQTYLNDQAVLYSMAAEFTNTADINVRPIQSATTGYFDGVANWIAGPITPTFDNSMALTGVGIYSNNLWPFPPQPPWTDFIDNPSGNPNLRLFYLLGPQAGSPLSAYWQTYNGAGAYGSSQIFSIAPA